MKISSEEILTAFNNDSNDFGYKEIENKIST
jgi:hypothetical protein